MSGKTVDGLMYMVRELARHVMDSADPVRDVPEFQLFDAIRAYAEALAAPQEQPAQESKLVPIEPTREMLDAGEDAAECPRELFDDDLRFIWHAMLEAAPAALPAVQPLTELQAVEALVSALSESRGWLRDYSRSVILAALDRVAVAPSVDRLMGLVKTIPPRAMSEERKSALDQIEGLVRALSAVQPEQPQSHGVLEVDEPLRWEATTTAYARFVTDSRYRKFSPAVQKWYRPICDKCGPAGVRGTYKPEENDRA